MERITLFAYRKGKRFFFSKRVPVGDEAAILVRFTTWEDYTRYAILGPVTKKTMDAIPDPDCVLPQKSTTEKNVFDVELRKTYHEYHNILRSNRAVS